MSSKKYPRQKIDLLINFATVYGYDLDSHRIQVGKKYIKNLYVADAMDDNVTLPSQLDFIILSNILEHLSCPRLFLWQLAKKLDTHAQGKESQILIDVPNLESAVYYGQGSFLKFLHIAHLWYFNSITIERLLNQLGFKINHIYSRNSSFTVMAQYTGTAIENDNNAYWNTISSINLANFMHDPNNIAHQVSAKLAKFF